MMCISNRVMVLVAVVSLLFGCSDDTSDSSDDSKKQHGKDSDSDDSGKDSGEETDGHEDTSDTQFVITDPEPEDLNEPPSDLPELCRLNTVEVAGEPVGRFPVSTGGDGRFPDIAVDLDSGRAAMVWAYIRSEGDENQRWGIQSTRYDISVDDDGEITREIGQIMEVTTASGSPLAEHPSLALTDDGYVAVYRDARYDESCEPIDSAGYDACVRSLALMTLDIDSNPTLDEPIRLSEGTTKNRPAIARTPAGDYIVAWNELEGNDYRTKAMRISTDLTLGEIHELPMATDRAAGPSVAANDQVAVIVYGIDSQDKIVSILWSYEDDTPGSEVAIIEESLDNARQPKIAAGDDGFMVSYNGRISLHYEVFLQPLDASGAPQGSAERGTWAYESVTASEVAWNGETYAMVWESSTENGASVWPRTDGVMPEEICAYEGCNEQIFATLVDENGRVASEPVLVSRDPNRSERSKIVWDGVGWTMIWQAWREWRWQILHGQILCD